MSLYEYDLTIKLKTDMPVDVLVEHTAHALRAVVDPNKRKADKDAVRIDVKGVRKPRQHPFDGPEVNDDLPDGTAGLIFRGEDKSGWEDTAIKGTIPRVDEAFIEVDVTDVLDAVYTAIGEDFPHLAELFQAKREEHKEREVRRNTEITDPLAEGDWELPGDFGVGDDID